MVNQPLHPHIKARIGRLPAAKTGLPSRLPNLKSAGGSPQRSEPVPIASSLQVWRNHRFQSLLRPARWFRRIFLAGLSAFDGTGLEVEKIGRVGTPAPRSVRAKSRSGLVRAEDVMGSSGYAMAIRAIIGKSGSSRATSAAGDLADGRWQRPANRNLSGRLTTAGARHGFAAALLVCSAAGETRRNAKQNADRRLPPGGNTSRRRTR